MSNDPLALIPTIEDDNVPDLDGNDDDDDDDVENEMQRIRAHKLAKATKGKSLDFNDGFQFAFDDPDERVFVKKNDFDDLKTRGQLSTIDEKIAEVRSRRRGKANKQQEQEQEVANDNLEDESYEMDLPQESKADKMKIKEKKTKKSKKNTKEDFFEESTTFNPDQVFSDMKISRPLLKVKYHLGNKPKSILSLLFRLYQPWVFIRQHQFRLQRFLLHFSDEISVLVLLLVRVKPLHFHCLFSNDCSTNRNKLHLVHEY